MHCLNKTVLQTTPVTKKQMDKCIAGFESRTPGGETSALTRILPNAVVGYCI